MEKPESPISIDGLKDTVERLLAVLDTRPGNCSAPLPPINHVSKDLFKKSFPDTVLEQLKALHSRNMNLMQTIEAYSRENKQGESEWFQELQDNMAMQRHLHTEHEEGCRKQLKKIVTKHPQYVNQEQLYFLYNKGVVILGDLSEEQQNMVINQEAIVTERQQDL